MEDIASLIKVELTEDTNGVASSPSGDASKRSSFYCNICTRSFAFMCQLNVHRRRVHQDILREQSQSRQTMIRVESLLVCLLCHKTLDDQRSLTQHVFQHEADLAELGNDCYQCHEKFSNPGDLRIHKVLAHNPGIFNQENDFDVAADYFHSNEFDADYDPYTDLYGNNDEEGDDEDDTAEEDDDFEFKKEEEDHVNEESFADGLVKNESDVKDEEEEEEEESESKEKYHVPSSKRLRSQRPKKKRRRNFVMIDPKPSVSGDYPCEACSRVFENAQKMKRHYREAHVKNHFCEVCGRAFSKLSAKERHTRIVHLKERSHKCDYCEMTFGFLGNLRMHVKTAHPDLEGKDYSCKCEFCGKVFSVHRYLARHLRRLHSETNPKPILDENGVEKKFDCSKCHVTFPDPKSLYLHCKDMHRDEIFPCRQCGICYDLKTSLEDHNKTVHPKKTSTVTERTYLCQECGQSFRSIKGLKRHESVVHDLTDKPYQCEGCYKAFDDQLKLDRHVHGGKCDPVVNGVNEDGNEGRYECTQCDKKYAIGANLSEHMHYAHGAARNGCPRCDSVLKTRRGLQKHIRNVHEDTRSWLCSHCGKDFRCNDSLKRHVVATHEKHLQFKCTFCEKGFTRKSCQVTHERKCQFNDTREDDDANAMDLTPLSDTKESASQCPECRARFADYRIMLRHLRINHPDFKPHSCPECGRRFLTAESLDKHFKKFHDASLDCPQCREHFPDQSSMIKHVKSHHPIPAP